MRYLIISNRLPLTIKNKSCNLSIEESSGGLVTGLSAYLQSLKGTHLKADYVWIGWPGLEVDKETEVSLKQEMMKDFNAYPVFFSEDVMENFYQGFCNKTIWPLFHYFPSLTDYKEEFWESYYSVNEQFCETVLSLVKDDDKVWIHDYHLMLLPKMLREKRPDLSIGFFLHIPFPTYEIYSLLPGKWRTGILQGLLGADVIGFHTHDYTQYFLRCVLRILGKDNEFGNLIINERNVKADTFPMGIDFDKFSSTALTPQCTEETENIRNTLNIEKIILSIDRLDYTKGILNRLYAYETFLEFNTGWHKRTKLLLKILPSRVGVDKYEILKQEIDQQVGRINGRFGTIDWTPISYQYGFIPFEPLVALYKAADIMLVTPLRDGMNLISKEYIACKDETPGVLILSEMTGASKELGEALIINPNYKEEIASAIETAINMSAEEQIRRNSFMQKRLKRYNVVRWAEDFLESLEKTTSPEMPVVNRIDSDTLSRSIISGIKNSEQSILFLDYDGTLVPFKPAPHLAVPPDELLETINRLSLIPNLDVVLISGREKNNMIDWFNGLDIFIVAEHGAWIRNKKKKWKAFAHREDNWKQQLFPILEIYVDRLPGAFVEEKEFALAWHYRNSDPELAVLRKKELIDQLVNITANKNLQIMDGKKVVEIKPMGTSKGLAGKRLLNRKKFDYIVSFGDDLTDEELFEALPERAVTIKVGKGHSCAKFNMGSYIEVNHILINLIKNSNNLTFIKRGGNL